MDAKTDAVYLDPIQKLTKDLAAAATTLGDKEVRFLVDTYYIAQESRKRTKNQLRALTASDEPHVVISWLFDQYESLEGQIKKALDKYTTGHPMGKWMREVYGVGPVISAGLLAHIDMNKAPTVGHIWSFAGWAADKQKKWEKGQKRPFNARFKTLCYKAGDCFVKFSNVSCCYYGGIYQQRRAYEIENNDSGRLIPQAEKAMELRPVAKTTEAWHWYHGCYPAGTTQAREMTGSGQPAAVRMEMQMEYLKSVRGAPGSGQKMLPPAHIQARAQRYAVKLFLAHLHGVWYVYHAEHTPAFAAQYGLTPPLPYPIAHLGHVHMIPPPHTLDVS